MNLTDESKNFHHGVYTVVPVSYTHLDVYKRQVEKNGNRIEADEVRPNAVDANVLANINAAINAAILENAHFNNANANGDANIDANVDAEAAARPARVVFIDLLKRLWNTGRRVVSFLAKVIFVMRILGIGIPEIIVNHWLKIMVWVFLLLNVYVLFFGGDRVATRIQNLSLIHI